MKQQGPGRRVRIYIGESDQWRGRPLYAAIVQEARKQGLAGATVARGVMGFGAHSAIHEPHLFKLSSDLPVVIEIVDTDEDRKSTRLNSSHVKISYAVFC